jgi:hypothetical protein
MMIKKYCKQALLLGILIGGAGNAHAQDTDSLSLGSWLKKGYLKGYGVVNYYNFDWETDPNRRNAIDAERLNLYLGYHFNDKIEFKSEIEYEHGGTGASMEFDVFEEFGEYEQEVEAGGEVILEQINLLFKLKDWLNIRLGKFRLYMGLAAQFDEPSEYFTTHRSEVENTILPLGWYEHGIELSGKINTKWAYKLCLINGLDATGFNSANWVRLGYQKRFEMVNAENMAVMGRLDYRFSPEGEVGVSAYFGNSSGNRPKPDTNLGAYVGVYDFHFLLDKKHWRARAYAMYGTLSNSEAISELNRNLSNNLNVKRTPVAAAALGGFAELGYNIFALGNNKKLAAQALYVFGRYDYYDSMFQTKGSIFDNPRWERSVITGGINYFPLPNIVLKAQYSNRSLGTGQTENTFSTGIGFDF